MQWAQSKAEFLPFGDQSLGMVLYGGFMGPGGQPQYNVGKNWIDANLAQIAANAGLPSGFDWTPYLAQAAMDHYNKFGQYYDAQASNYAHPVTAAVQAALSDYPQLQEMANQTVPGTPFWNQGEAIRAQQQDAIRTASRKFDQNAAVTLGSFMAGGALLAGGGAAAGELGAGGGALTGESAALASNIGGASGLGLTSAEAAALGTGAASVAAPALGSAAPVAGAGESFIPATTGSNVTVGALAPGTAQGMGAALPALTSVPAGGALQALTNAAASEAVKGALSQEEKAAMVESGTTGTYGAAMEADALGTGSIDQYLNSMPPATQGLLAQLGLGSAGEALTKLMKLGLPIATIAGLFEKPNNPLLEPIVDAAKKAIGQADKFAALGPIGLTPAQEQAISLAKENVGKWQPYLDKSGALADTAAGGITQEQIDRYTNPYLQGVLDPAIRDIEESAARRREQLRAVTSMSGNDLRTPSTDPNRFNVEDSLLDRETLRSVGDVSGKLRAESFNTATGLAGQDLDRSLSSSNIYGGLGKSAGALGAADVAGLTSAGALERQPLEDARTQASDASKLYTGVVHGNQGALAAAAQPSTLTNVTGALGTLQSAKELGLY